MDITGNFHPVEPSLKKVSCYRGRPFRVNQSSETSTLMTLLCSQSSETSKLVFDEDHLRMNRADAMYAVLGMPIRKPAGDGEFAGPIWGAHLDGQRGKLGFPMCRRAT